MRRSISLNDDTDRASHYQLQERPSFSRHISFQVIAANGRRAQKETSESSWTGVQSASSSLYDLPCEENIGTLLRNAMSDFVGSYLRVVFLPALLFLTFAYSFTYLPVPPKADIYKSVSATFVILMGIIFQSCFLTGWAARNLGFGDFLLLLRYSMHHTDT